MCDFFLIGFSSSSIGVSTWERIINLLTPNILRFCITYEFRNFLSPVKVLTRCLRFKHSWTSVILLLEPKVQRKVIVSNGKLGEGLAGLECSGPLHIVAFEEAKCWLNWGPQTFVQIFCWLKCLMICCIFHFPHPLHGFEDAYKNCKILRKITVNGSPVLKVFPGLWFISIFCPNRLIWRPCTPLTIFSHHRFETQIT